MYRKYRTQQCILKSLWIFFFGNVIADCKTTDMGAYFFADILHLYTLYK